MAPIIIFYNLLITLDIILKLRGYIYHCLYSIMCDSSPSFPTNYLQHHPQHTGYSLAAFGSRAGSAFSGLAALGRPTDLGRVVMHNSAFYTIVRTSVHVHTSRTLGTLASAFGTFRALGCFVGLA